VTRKTEDEKEARARRDRKEAYIRTWAQLPLPNPAYDPRTGWKLDEFAMHCEPDGLREYKQISFNMNFPHLAKKKQIPIVEWVITFHFPLVIGKRLLEPRFRVTGFRPAAYEPEEVPIPLLERMYPVIELSDLLDISERPAPRRYELVRVFKSSGIRGVHAKYDWRRLARRMEEEAVIYPRDAELVRFCRANVWLVSGEKPEALPDDATTRAAISKYGLWKFSSERGEGSGKKRPD